ncbi:hypothetical protein HYFRA_00011098 [Hymenoscyphus fraxineus]|uniref:Uncharacterized protein n=1 Tax=Hymenoscyphus fraxineus TaxID=746836 RepID=A0A9N9L217_9HELO|nr:hypothetical protein HYFRA_00011098 [Hymenoscyphus fraxineus]
MERKNLMSDQILASFQRFWQRLRPNIRPASPVLEFALVPPALDDAAGEQSSLTDFEPFCGARVEGGGGAWSVAVCEPGYHGAYVVEPARGD